jgi:hypothetical protein
VLLTRKRFRCRLRSVVETNNERETTMSIATVILENYAVVEEFSEGDACPVHGTKHRKTYTFGSTMSAETEACTFTGCRCTVAIKHDPCGCLPSEAVYCEDFDTARGIGKLRAMDAAIKYR